VKRTESASADEKEKLSNRLEKTGKDEEKEALYRDFQNITDEKKNSQSQSSSQGSSGFSKK
jgi:hypothetical protein